jgi:uncharacterized protein
MSSSRSFSSKRTKFKVREKSHMERTMDKSRIWTPLDFSKDGKWVDWLRLPYSSDILAYGWIPIPLVCIKNGEGPTALLLAGSHGDEYEGQIALLNLARRLDVADVRGRVVIIPALNSPAVLRGTRVSPLDHGNLNRCFPGSAHGTPTEMIAQYVSSVLFPMSDIVLDLHSGGRSLDYVCSALIHQNDDADEFRQMIELLRVFGAPISFVTNGEGGGGNTTLAASAEKAGVRIITAELGGGSTLCHSGLKVAEEGVCRVLKHFGITPRLNTKDPKATRFMKDPGKDYFVYALNDGIFEPLAEVGQEVRADQIAGRIHMLDGPTKKPIEIYFPKSGKVVCRRHPALTSCGDCLFNLMIDVEGWS